MQPIVVVCGRPCVGKTAFANAFVAYCLGRGVAAKLVNEETLGIRHADGYGSTLPSCNLLCQCPFWWRRGVCICASAPTVCARPRGVWLFAHAAARDEKMTRAALKSAVERFATSSTLVVLDSMNYIKGYRYELYCVSRATASTRCTVRAW